MGKSKIETITSKKFKIQVIITFVGVLLFIIKFIAYFVTNSVTVLSDALESTVNIVTAVVTLRAIKFAAVPYDEDHPYGHGKIELITASFEGLLIGGAGIFIIIEAVNRLGHQPELLSLDVGIILISFTAVVNYILGRYSIRAGNKYNSIALVTGGEHLKTDTYSSVALTAGLVLFYLTGLFWLDSVIAIFFGLFIIYAGYKVLRNTITGLMDEADSKSLQIIFDVLVAHRRPQWINIHKLTLLKFGNVAHVDMHLTLPWYYNMRQALEEVTFIKSIIREQFPETETDISIQCEPCLQSMCSNCTIDCDVREQPYIEQKEWTLEQITGKNIYK